MGYTNYWTQTRDFTNDEWTKVKTEYDWLLEMDDQRTIKDETTKQDGVNDLIIFNGKKELSHETMIITKKKSGIAEFQFCKTARKPYDIGVWHMLAFIKSNTEAYSKISRDDFGDWA